MIIIGVDFHPEFQQIALLNTTTGEVEEKRLAHPDEAEKFYRALASANETVRIGMEASGHARWLERLMAELQFELWIGDAAVIRTKRVRKQKTDRQDAQLILSLLIENRFPKIWVPSSENRDLRQLLTVRSLPEWRSKYFHLVLRRGRKIAKVAMARRLAVQLFWMMRKEWDYEQLKKFGSHAGQPGHSHGV